MENIKLLKPTEDIKRSDKYRLYDCYTSVSSAKLKAEERCMRLMYELQGYDFKIIGYNSMQFSAGFIYELDGKEVFMYITKTYDRSYLVADLMR